ncbi:hypothetical protein ACFQ0B_33775 [Nonomuraea thailandensis]
MSLTPPGRWRLTGGPRLPDPDRRLLVRARRRITVQVAGAISVVLALVGVLVWCAMGHGQGTAAERDLAAAAQRSPVAHPPPCVWLYELRSDGTVRPSPARRRRCPYGRRSRAWPPEASRRRRTSPWPGGTT